MNKFKINKNIEITITNNNISPKIVEVSQVHNELKQLNIPEKNI